VKEQVILFPDPSFAVHDSGYVPRAAVRLEVVVEVQVTVTEPELSVAVTAFQFAVPELVLPIYPIGELGQVCWKVGGVLSMI
jgi:hypothetical protein